MVYGVNSRVNGDDTSASSFQRPLPKKFEEMPTSIESRRPLILLKGIRRLGKAFLLRVIPNEANTHKTVNLRS
ncbi:hypothetical protein [Thermococcus sp.]|uniref:hypothetical protein n=1 Tax=Thermococcus sp. TaxID=35749 RepID=UPI00262C289B|nr:hypothetical protein [Thermococcus sp.]